MKSNAPLDVDKEPQTKDKLPKSYKNYLRAAGALINRILCHYPTLLNSIMAGLLPMVGGVEEDDTITRVQKYAMKKLTMY